MNSTHRCKCLYTPPKTSRYTVERIIAHITRLLKIQQDCTAKDDHNTKTREKKTETAQARFDDLPCHRQSLAVLSVSFSLEFK